MARKFTILWFDTYLQLIKNSVKAESYRNFYVQQKGKKKDILQHGELSCAWFVTSILLPFSLINKAHVTVDTTVLALKKSGWKKISKPRLGCIIVWQEIKYPDGENHGHIGFYLGNHRAISNSTTRGYPVKHHWTYGCKSGQPRRGVKLLLWHPKLTTWPKY